MGEELKPNESYGTLDEMAECAEQGHFAHDPVACPTGETLHKKSAKRPVAIRYAKRVLALVATLVLVCSMVQEALAAGTVSYREASWDETNKTVVYTDKSVDDSQYQSLSDFREQSGTVELGKGYSWYVVNKGTHDNSSIDINGSITIASDATIVNLILCDGAKLNANQGITVPAGKTLNIYAQSEGTGQLIAKGGSGNAGIGGGNGGSDGTIIIHGGDIQATGASDAAGIGGGAGGNGGAVTIYGGTVTATGGSGGAGIGGGLNSSGNGGSGDEVTIYGGTVTAQGGYDGAGIGGGAGGSSGTGGSGGTVKIYGGTVTAKGSDESQNGRQSYGAGIGGGSGGSGGDGGTVEIYGASVTAQSGSGGGVGIGRGGAYSTPQDGNDGSLVVGCNKVYGGDSENPTTEIRQGERKKYMVVEVNHALTYSASDTTITATCGNANCNLADHKVSLTIVPPTRTIYCQPNTNEEATLEDLAAFLYATGLSDGSLPITYYKATKSGTTYENTGAAIAAPIYPGNYVAEVTLTNVRTSEGEGKSAAASVGYSISNADMPVAFAYQTGTLTYTGKAQAPEVYTESRTVDDQQASFSYSRTAGGPYSDGVPRVTNVADCGTYYFKASALYHNDAFGSFEVTMSKAEQDPPSAPTMASRTATSITLTAVADCEYSMDGTHWQEKTTFTGLSACTTYTFYQKIKERANHKPSAKSDPTSITTEEHSHTVTFRVVNGSFDDGTTADKSVTLTGSKGQHPKLGDPDIPAVGNKPASGYKAGSWDTTPRSNATITQDVTYTYTYAKQASKSKSNARTGSGSSAVCQRLAGADRYGTMAAVVEAGFASADRVILASGTGFADALAASALAGSWACPVVLTAPGSLSAEAKAQILRLNPSDVVIMGGEASVSGAVEAEVAALGRHVERIAGTDRAETSALALDRLVAGGLASKTVVVVTGSTFVDALSAGPWCYATTAPVVLASANGTLSRDVVDAVLAGGFERVVIVGGTSSVSDAVMDQLGDTFTYERISGTDRYATSVAFSEFVARSGLSWSSVYVASGESFPDALAGSPLVGKNGGVLLLTRDGSTAATDAVRAHSASVKKTFVLGGEASVSPSALASLEEATK